MFTPPENLVRQHHEPRLRNALPSVILGHPAPGSRSIVLPGHEGIVVQIAYSLEGDLLASASVDQWNSKGDMIVWDVQTGAQLAVYELEGTSLTCYGIAFLPGNETVVSIWVGADPDSPFAWKLYRLGVDSDDLVSPPQALGGEGDINCVAWAPTGTHIVCGTLDGRMSYFALDTGSIVGTITQAHESKINSIAYSPDGLSVVTTSPDNTFKIWTVGSDGLSGPSVVWNSEYLEIYGASFNPVDPSLLAVAVGDGLQFHNTTTGALELEAGLKDAFTQTTFSPDGEYVATLGYGQSWITLTTCKNDQVVGLRLDTGHNVGIRTVAFSPDKIHIVSGGEDQTLRIHKLADTGPAQSVKGHQGRVRRMAFTPDCKRLVSSDENGVLCTWDLKAGKLLEGPIKAELAAQNVVAYSSDGSTVATASMGYDICLLNLKTEAKHPLELNLGYPTASDPEIHAMVFSPDDSALAFMAHAYFEDCEREILFIKSLHAPAGTADITIEHDLQPIPPTFSLGYHPSGKYICCGEQAWDLGVTPPTKIAGDILDNILKETFPVTLEYRYNTEPLPTMSLGSPARRTLYVPLDLLAEPFGFCDALIVLGSQDGRVTVLDFTPLLTPEETALLKRVGESFIDVF